ncbi:MAG: hypothetical protein E7381_03020 [Clostridiales bacterium]|nr:hypothetical protein [Clostridiales bacterium]
MENYVKAVLYAYPLLETVETDYGEHIYNKAILSYKSEKPAEVLAEYIVGELIEKERLVWLKTLTEKVLATLSDVERTWIAVRYFGKEKRIKSPLPPNKRKEGRGFLSEGQYFRMQQRLGNRVGERLVALGLDKTRFEKEFKDMKIFEEIFKFLERKKECCVSQRERKWINVGKESL